MSRTVTVGDIIRLLDAIAPPKWALANDKIGLQVGNVERSVSRVWVALEASPEVVEEAIAQGVHLIITHHALLFAQSPSSIPANAGVAPFNGYSPPISPSIRRIRIWT